MTAFDPRLVAEAFEPVALAQVDGRAALSVRTDRKYLVGLATFALLADALADCHHALEVGGRRLREYDSVYFDTPELATYRQHLQGRRRRYKCRTRLYGAGGPCYFEVKLKGRRGETVKRRLEVPPAAHGTVTDAARSFLQRELYREYGLASPAELEPVVATSFTRLTLVSRGEAERVTCDFDVAFRRRNDEYELLAGRVLVETKTAVGNGAADRQLRRLGARPLPRCSKYCLAVALSHDGVRDNEFRRLLRRHFAARANGRDAAALAPLGGLA